MKKFRFFCSVFLKLLNGFKQLNTSFELKSCKFRFEFLNKIHHRINKQRIIDFNFIKKTFEKSHRISYPILLIFYLIISFLSNAFYIVLIKLIRLDTNSNQYFMNFDKVFKVKFIVFDVNENALQGIAPQGFVFCSSLLKNINQLERFYFKKLMLVLRNCHSNQVKKSLPTLVVKKFIRF